MRFSEVPKPKPVTLPIEIKCWGLRVLPRENFQVICRIKIVHFGVFLEAYMLPVQRCRLGRQAVY